MLQIGKFLLPSLQITENKCLARALPKVQSLCFQAQNRYWFLFQTLMPELAVSGWIRGRWFREFNSEQAAWPDCLFWVIFFFFSCLKDNKTWDIRRPSVLWYPKKYLVQFHSYIFSPSVSFKCQFRGHKYIFFEDDYSLISFCWAFCPSLSFGKIKICLAV